MTIEELKKAISEKESRKDTLVKRAMKSQAVEHVRAIRNEVEVLNDEIKELKNQLSNTETRSNETPEDKKEVEVPESANHVNADITRSIYGGGASFSVGSGSGVVPGLETNKLELRKDETFVSRVPQFERKSLDLGKYIRGAVLGQWSGSYEERDAFTTSSTGVLIPSVLSAHIIDKARNISLFTNAGVPIVPMLSNNLTIARVKTDPVFAFKEELAEADPVDFELEPVDLKAKTAYGYAYVSLEAIRSASNLSEILYQVFSQAFADMCDKAMLYGQENENALVDYAPSGIFNDADVNSIVATNNGYNDFIRAIGKIKRANGNPTIVGMNAATEEFLSLLTDSNKNVLLPPEAYNQLTKIVSNQLIEDENNGSDALVFDPNAMIIGVQNQMTIRMIQDSDYCIKNGAVGFQIYAMMDCAVAQPKHITKITGIKEVVSNANSNENANSND